jgi:caffeoyl-CoA O-methyltransferase
MKTDRDWYPVVGDLDWIESVAAPIHPVLAEIEIAADPEGIPILDRASGRVLAALSADRLRIVEVGTAIGYSTLWMALAQPRGGTIVTIDPDAERTGRARAAWRRAGIEDDRITVLDAPALDALAADAPALAGPFDLAFIDALKHEYPAYLAALRARLAPGALVVADNILRGGRTSGTSPSRAGDGTAELRAFVDGVMADPGLTAAVLPIGDGLLVATVRG